MRFAYPQLLLLLILAPAMAAFYFFALSRKKRALEKIAEAGLFEKLSSFSFANAWIKAWLTILGAAFIIVSLARPQFGTKLVEVKQKGADIVIAVDVSSSMLAQDLKPNRLEKAKELLTALISELQGNRIGIVAFAGASFWQCPLTLDVSACNLFLQIMDASLIPLPGTSIGSAIRTASEGLEKTSTKSKALILLTDGEDHKSGPEDAAKEAADNNIRIYTIGFGNPNGEPVPVYGDDGRFGGYKKDKQGKTVMSKLDEKLLVRISDITGGKYYRAENGMIPISRLVRELKGLDKDKLKSNMSRQYEDRYQFFLFFGLALLLAELFVPENRKREAAAGN